MEQKHAKKKDGGGLYIAICCCILVIALIGYANNVSQKNKAEEEFIAEQAAENTVAPEIVPSEELLIPTHTPEPEPVYEEDDLISEMTPVSNPEYVNEVAEFLPPVGGKILSEFSDKQIFYENIEEWRTHNGIDIEASIGDSVACAMNGIVSKVFMGSLGYSVQVDHDEGLSTIYSNLDENPTVAIGDAVNKGDVVGHIGQSALADMTEKPHLHFEILENGVYVNPSDYLNR